MSRNRIILKKKKRSMTLHRLVSVLSVFLICLYSFTSMAGSFASYAQEETPENDQTCEVSAGEIVSEPASDGAVARIKGDLPENASAEIKKVKLTDSELSGYLGVEPEAVDSYAAYDISVDSDGEEWQPDEAVDVTIDGAAVDHEDCGSVAVAHIDSRTDEAEHLQSEVGESGDISFSTEGFSLYIFYTFTVDFHYEEKTFSMDGMSSMLLSDILEELGLEGAASDIASVRFSDDSLVKTEETDDGWMLTSLKAFDTDETLTITYNSGDELIIDVTDAKTTADDEWELVTSESQLTQDGTYIIVSGTGSSGYMLGASGTNSTAAATSVSLTVQQNAYYKLNKETDEANQWKFTQSGTGYTIRNDGNGRYINFSSSTSSIISETSRSMTMQYSSGYWNIKYGSYYLAYTSSAFRSISGSTNAQMRILKLVESAPAETELIVTKQWTDGNTSHDPIKVYLYKQGTDEPVDQISLSESNGWSATFTGLIPKSRTELGYYIKEGSVSGYISQVGEIKHTMAVNTVWVPSKTNTFTAGKEYAIYSNGRIITRNGTNGLATKTVTVGGQIAVNGTVYTSHITDDQVGDTGGWLAASSGSYASLSNGGYYMQNASTLITNSSSKAGQMRVTSMSGGYGYVQFYTKDDDDRMYLRVKDDNTVTRTSKSSSATRFMIYEKVQSTSTGDSYNVTITNRPVKPIDPSMTVEWNKKIDYLGDGAVNPDTQASGDDLYRLYMDIDTCTQPVDLLLVVDCSNSMKGTDMGNGASRYGALDTIINGTVTYAPDGKPVYNKTYAETCSRAEDGLVYKFLNANSKNRIAVLGYGNSTKISRNWIDKAGITNNGTNTSPKDYYTDVTHLDPSRPDGQIVTGTNYELALRDAKTQLLDTRTDRTRQTVVVFMTDGEPNRHLKNGVATTATDTAEDAGDYAARYLLNNIYNDADHPEYKDMPLYIIGISKDATAGNAKDILENMAFSVGGEYYASNTASEMTAALMGIVDKLRSTPLQFMDDLSAYADFADDPEVKVTMKNKKTGTQKTLWTSSGPAPDNRLNGTDIIEDVSVTGKNITAKVNPDLVLDDDYIITLSYNVKSNSEANKEFLSNGYSDKGDDKTDYGTNATSSGIDGFHSNEKANVVFKVSNNKYDASYKHPVLQVKIPRAALKITKVDSADNSLKLKGAEFMIYEDNGDGKFGDDDAKATVYSDSALTKEAVQPLATPDSGEIMCYGFEQGKSFWLVETKAPSGYFENRTPASFVFTSDTEGSFDGKTITAVSAAEFETQIRNTKIYKLPNAGGIGIYIFLFIGAFIMSIAITGGLKGFSAAASGRKR